MVPQVFGILRRGGGEAEIASYLLAVQTEGIGPPSEQERARSAAAVLVAWRDALADGTAERPIGRL